MENIRTFSGNTETEIWQQIAADMIKQKEILEYRAQINQEGHQIYFDVDIDLGGGFEGGFESTTFMAPVPGNIDLKFHLYPQDWLNEVGKILGMEDVEFGYPEFDKTFIVKSNKPETIKKLFADEFVRQVMLKYKGCDLKLSPEHDERESHHLLQFSLDLALIDPENLREIYGLMLRILKALNP